MGAKPVLGLNLVAYPARTRALDKLEQILKGAADQAAKAGVSIVGGHSIDDLEPKYGMVAMGLVHPDKILTNASAKVGDHLILTKPIGLGIISTAIKRDAASESIITKAIEIMTTLNKAASEAAVEIGVNALTDVTGFGLLGHLNEMVTASKVGAKIKFSSVPIIDGVSELLEADMAPGGTYSNMNHMDNLKAVDWSSELAKNERLLLCDAQTSGGLLISVSAEKSEDLISKLHDNGVSMAIKIGEIVKGSKIVIEE